MTDQALKVRDKAAKQKEVLGINHGEFENLRAFARVVHKTYIAEFPQSAWANPSVNFGVIPERERRVLIERVIQRCTEARTFAEGTPASLIENGVVVRLKLVRTAWIQNMQKFDRGWRKVILLTVVEFRMKIEAVDKDPFLDPR
ncbi:hypothetical protein LTR47_002830 [Exophiala xenobiotica]|nr:hypothetical protein LTR92_004824 [Exophiala xenobiotica]KAK5209939.1 hypothetical protein LTR41_004571 [Exophiala xenobiotica]KAK5225814.1 hypothetical protein LTR72_003717 [Exophiala xenobiotica]KAK5236104.1 hypothetical protein LTR47_002830 [Exophiala xenobiotica]KAK5253812.1 hypothetical protein LTS06_001941 [Exophiala xenobiotica]